LAGVVETSKPGGMKTTSSQVVAEPSCKILFLVILASEFKILHVIFPEDRQKNCCNKNVDEIIPNK
jgi:hypothetical protein